MMKNLLTKILLINFSTDSMLGTETAKINPLVLFGTAVFEQLLLLPCVCCISGYCGHVVTSRLVT